jgi:holo-[acyl-carrier protein] synthase
MIFGIGSDIAYIPRFKQWFHRCGERAVKKILTPSEQVEFYQRHDRHPDRAMAFFASRFAAKEAFSKACGLGMTAPMNWQSVQVINLASGQPQLQTIGNMAVWFTERQLNAHLSLSDERDYAIAYVVISTTCIAQPSPQPL